MNSIFHNEGHILIEKELHKKLEKPLVLDKATVADTRATGAKVEKFLAGCFPEILEQSNIPYREYKIDHGRKAMPDMSWRDGNNDYLYYVDVKTHRLKTTFSMPNLTSVQKIAEFYSESCNYFIICMIDYELNGEK